MIDRGWGNLPIFPFDHDNELGTLVTWVRWLGGAFVSNNAPALSQIGPIIILLVNVIEDLIVWDNFLVLIIMVGASELEPFGITVELGILLFNGLDNVGTEPLTILLGIKREGVANKVGGVEHRELRSIGLISPAG